MGKSWKRWQLAQNKRAVIEQPVPETVVEEIVVAPTPKAAPTTKTTTVAKKASRKRSVGSKKVKSTTAVTT